LWQVRVAPNLSISTPACGYAGLPLSFENLHPGSTYCWIGAFAPFGGACALGISTDPGSTALGPCTVGLGLAPGQLLVPNGGFGIVNLGPSSGSTYFLFQFPPGFPLVGDDYYAQWIYQDPAGPITSGAGSFALSGTRRLLVW
jgi:hypothetical protein